MCDCESLLGFANALHAPFGWIWLQMWNWQLDTVDSDLSGEVDFEEFKKALQK
jgi:hypothetical protein